MNKYHNRKVRTSDGIYHDSKREAIRWNELKLFQEAGRISDLRKKGYSINDKTETVENRYGEKVRIKRYSLEVYNK